MDDKMLLEELLCYEKNLCDIYLHASIESSNENIFDIYRKSLDETLKIQHQVYKMMENAGFYTVEQVENKNVKKAQQKFNCEQ